MADAGIDNATHLMPPLQAREPSVRAYDVSRLTTLASRSKASRSDKAARPSSGVAGWGGRPKYSKTTAGSSARNVSTALLRFSATSIS